MERWLSGLKRIPAKDKYLFGTKGSNPFLSVISSELVVQWLEHPAHNGYVAGSSPARLICYIDEWTLLGIKGQKSVFCYIRYIKCFYIPLERLKMITKLNVTSR